MTVADLLMDPPSRMDDNWAITSGDIRILVAYATCRMDKVEAVNRLVGERGWDEKDAFDFVAFAR